MTTTPARWLLVPLLVGCHAKTIGTPGTTTHSGGPGTTPTTTGTFDAGFEEGLFCPVQTVFELSCVTGCHSSVVPEAGLDLHTDPYDAIVNVPSSLYTGTLVVPGSSADSLLYHKMTGDLQPDQGTIMPPQGEVDAFMLAPVKAWIDAGAPNDCVDPGDDPTQDTFTGTGNYHPPGWEEPDQHGMAAKMQTGGDCRTCHGANLDGGSSPVTCDDCHPAGWRDDCTFCHGGVLDQTGAPPEDIDDNADPATIAFTAHPAHVETNIHAAYDCIQCHVKPTDLLDPGHVVHDITPGFGEIDYTQGLSPIATYYQGTCSNTYCHGNGRVPGEVSDGDGPFGCDGCHADLETPNRWNEMSGQHQRHLSFATCADCHGLVVDAQENVVDPSLHVNGTVTVTPSGMAWDGASCTGSCHGHNHNGDRW